MRSLDQLRKIALVLPWTLGAGLHCTPCGIHVTGENEVDEQTTTALLCTTVWNTCENSPLLHYLNKEEVFSRVSNDNEEAVMRPTWLAS